MCFTFAMIALISMLAFLAGPRLYVKKLFMQQNLYASIVLITSILGAIWFSMIQQSYLMSILMCVIELNAVMFYFCKTSAVSLTTVRWICKGLLSWIGGFFRNI